MFGLTILIQFILLMIYAGWFSSQDMKRIKKYGEPYHFLVFPAGIAGVSMMVWGVHLLILL